LTAGLLLLFAVIILSTSSLLSHPLFPQFNDPKWHRFLPNWILKSKSFICLPSCTLQCKIYVFIIAISTR
jgi:hypothetical protein